MMERFIERLAESKYKDNFIIKGGFLISAIVGIESRTTMDIDTTIKGVPVNQESIDKILKEIISIDLDDNIHFGIMDIKNIREESEYDDFRVSLEAIFFTIRVKLKIDITTGDLIIPREIRYSYKLMFEERKVEVLAYKIDTILAEKIESIIVRNISNTRARDYYDVFILFKLKKDEIDLSKLKNAIYKKSEERGTLNYMNNYEKYIQDIRDSKELEKIWDNYIKKYSYAKGIDLQEVINTIEEIFTFNRE